MEQHRFTSTFGFLMAATGFAVGLGNIWRFPYVTGENGGGAFVLVYLLCVVGIGIPILIAEIFAGRRGGANPPVAITNLARSEGTSPRWRHLGHLNLLTAFVIEGTYCVVAGWVIWYLFKAVTTGFVGFDADLALSEFARVQGSLDGMLLWTFMGLLVTGGIIYLGVNAGIERSVRVLMPVLFALILSLVAYNATQPGFMEATAYLFTPDFSKISGEIFLEAVGHAFFSIGVAMAGMMIFGSYLPPSASITRCALVIIAIDTAVALFAGLMIFPMVFRFGLDPAGGTGLIFQTLPVVFAQMPGGNLVAVTFFALLSVAAVTSMVGLIEPLVAWVEERFDYPRRQATLVILGSVGVLAVAGIVSHKVITDPHLGSLDLSGLLDYLANKIMLPVGGLLIAVFIGWNIDKGSLRQEIPGMGDAIFDIWHFLIRYPVPAAIAIILVAGLR